MLSRVVTREGSGPHGAHYVQLLSPGASGARLAALDLDRIADAQERARVQRLLPLREDVRTALRAAQVAIQRLRHESNRRKGEQGPPTLTRHTLPPPPKTRASAQARRQPHAWSKGPKTACLPSDRAQMGAVEPARLPPAAVCQGYAAGVVQAGLCRTDPVLGHQEQCDAPSQPQPSLASLPQGSCGPGGPGRKSLALGCYGGAQRREPKVAERWRRGGRLADGPG